MLTLLAGALVTSCPRVGAQEFGLSVTPSSSSVLVNNSLTYTINVTNLVGNLADAVVTNVLPASAQFLSATNYFSGFYTNSNNIVLFDLGSFSLGQVAMLTVTAEPTASGAITDTVTVASAYVTNTASTNVVVNVTNAVIQADLGVTMTGPSQVVITNDWMTYGVTVTNLGPNAAPNVSLTNTLPPGVLLKGVFPNLTYATSGSNMLFNLGTLTNNSGVNLQFTVEPTNVATLLFSASVGAPEVMDTNMANNFASTNIRVIAYLPGTLLAVTNSAQNPDFVSGLMEQYVLLSNTGTNNVAAARVVVTGLTNRLYNAIGTNDGNPFVYYSTNIVAGQSARLMLQFYPNNYFSLTTNQLHAYAVPMPNWAPPAVTATSTNLNISRIVELNNGWMLVEFPTTPGQTYTMVYSDNVSFSNAMIAPPSVVAPANWVEWIDYGPPATVTAPTNAGTRFYRVYQNP